MDDFMHAGLGRIHIAGDMQWDMSRSGSKKRLGEKEPLEGCQNANFCYGRRVSRIVWFVCNR